MKEKTMRIIKVHADDNVALALESLKKGETVEVDGQVYTLLDDIPFGHKFALRDIEAGEDLVKYGETIGQSTLPIKAGAWVHAHNVRNVDMGKAGYTYAFNEKTVPLGSSETTFMGYLRDDGRAGIRNYIAIIPTVFCANGPAQKLAQM
ncbi:MAG: altronate dehydratase family protein, partial [Deltaproteobacteria bacterium]|nr:altronate dehydratase family protein [Deltaproteobacteria bacterium]